ncbi:hypothetical protein CSA37_02965 [Candidatus Fermentibacteria bacterium]|nr:MAG: hypothetical protein CSA37_02965 [Candidatus Fermentibacteria bacterium]
MQDFLGLDVFLQTLLKAGIVWVSFYGTGRILHSLLKIEKVFLLFPPEITGILFFVLLVPLLTLFGILTRPVCSAIILVFSLPGLFILYSKLKDALSNITFSILTITLIIALVFVSLLNLSYASMPNLAFDDPLVTYAVQPDKWLNNGGMYWLEETVFSGFPLLYEMTAVWPASLSQDRLNQLSILQVFQVTLLFIALFRSMRILDIKRSLRIPAALIVLLNTYLYYWCTMAKTDTMAILFSTLALAFALRNSGNRKEDSSLYSSWLFMGLAMATKQTTAIVLIPVFFYTARSFLPLNWKKLAFTAVCFLAVPAAFGIRTMVKTGSPAYPVNPVSFMVKEEWQQNEPEENIMINNRASEFYSDKDFSLAKQFGVFFLTMEGCILLLIGGTVYKIFSRDFSDLTKLIPFLAYSAIAVYVFWPPWWGAKYSILIYPFCAILGTYLLSSWRYSKQFAAAAVIPVFVIPGFFFTALSPWPFIYRYTVLESVVSGSWDNHDSGYKMYLSTPEGMLNLWANSALSDDDVIVSLQQEKRYFFSGTVIVGWRHPLAQKLYLENTLEDEIEILRELNAGYIACARHDPAVLDQEDRLLILDHIGIGELLEPVTKQGNYALYRINY